MNIKIKLHPIAIAVGLALAAGVVSAPAWADGGPSISFEQSSNVGGQTQKFTNSISPDSFSVEVITERLVQADLNSSFGQLNLWATSTPKPIANPESFGLPYPPFTASELFGSPATSRQDDQDAGQQMARTLPEKIPDYWAAWAAENGLLDYNYYIKIKQQCLASSNTSNAYYQNIKNGLLGATGCAVKAYIQAYNYLGFTEKHDLLGMVPLCEVQQANSCGIVPGFSPSAILNQVIAQRRVRQESAANNAASRAMVLHNQAYQRYLALKDGKTPSQPVAPVRTATQSQIASPEVAPGGAK
jgi:hypothetical protein